MERSFLRLNQNQYANIFVEEKRLQELLKLLFRKYNQLLSGFIDPQIKNQLYVNIIEAAEKLFFIDEMIHLDLVYYKLAICIKIPLGHNRINNKNNSQCMHSIYFSFPELIVLKKNQYMHWNTFNKSFIQRTHILSKDPMPLNISIDSLKKIRINPVENMSYLISQFKIQRENIIETVFNGLESQLELRSIEYNTQRFNKSRVLSLLEKYIPSTYPEFWKNPKYIISCTGIGAFSFKYPESVVFESLYVHDIQKMNL